MTNPIQGISVDVDNTLYSVRKTIVSNWFRVLPWLRSLIKLHEVREEMRAEGLFGDFHLEQAKRLARRLLISEEKAIQLAAYLTNGFWSDAIRRMRPYPGVLRALHFFQKAGIHLALISDYPIEHKIRNLGLGHISFSSQIVSEKLGVLKPNTKVFLKAAEEINISPSNILHIGDREDCDGKGARAAGMHTALFARRSHHRSHTVDLVFSDWRVLLRKINERFGVVFSDKAQYD